MTAKPKAGGQGPFEPATCLDLLTDELPDMGWQLNIGTQQSFYIRRVTWFRTTILNNMRMLSEYAHKAVSADGETYLSSALEAYESRLRGDKPDWFDGGFDWNKAFSPRRAGDALTMRQRKPLSFDKAAKTIHLCACATEDLNAKGVITATADDVLVTMKIEPAVFYIQDFTTDIYRAIKRDRPSVAYDLRRVTSQSSLLVFDHMAAGYTVTRALAEKVRNCLLEFAPEYQLGEVRSAYFAQSKGATKEEALRD